MQQNKTILALFADNADAEAMSSCFFHVPEVISVIADRFLKVTLGEIASARIEPGLAVISSALYPGKRPQLVEELRGYFPGLEILILAPASMPPPSLERFMLDQVRHLIIENRQEKAATGDGDQPLSVAIGNLILKRQWRLGQYVKKGTEIQEFQLSFSEEKEQIIKALEDSIVGDSMEYEMLRQKGALLADEMLENAFYGAPKSDDGMKIFRKGERRQILPDEGIVFRFAFDGETLAMEIKDGWGTLGADMVLEYLAKNSADMGAADDAGGRGLFIIWRFLDHFHVCVNPGKETLIGGHLKKSSQVPPETIHGFHITTTG
ncbi:ATP-binding protein [Geotalea toluenoxydans]|uniref:ATP-binding protein n=1 Tax=Geotalea toluenoxydans TaxID=421624 RepID=UPI0006D24D7D|nr:ATP-binding protein [Geotalea toluenoxydans]